MPYEGELLASEFNLEALFIMRTENEELIKCISQLLPKQQELLKKIYFEGFSHTDIAQIEGTSRQAIENRLKKIYEKIKKFLI